MNLEETIAELEARIKEEKCKLEEQASLVESLGKEYNMQTVIFRAIDKTVKTLEENLADLNNIQNISSRKYEGLVRGEIEARGHEQLTRLLDKAVTELVKQGSVAELIKGKDGRITSVRDSLTSRARNGLCSHPKYLNRKKVQSPVDFLMTLSYQEITKLRNVGPKAASLLIKAQELAKEGDDREYDRESDNTSGN